MRNFLKSKKKKVSKLVKQKSNIIYIRFPILYAVLPPPPFFFPTHIHTPLLQLRSSNFFFLYIMPILYVCIHIWRLPPSFNLMIPVQKRFKIYLCPPPLPLSFSSSLCRFFFLSLCLSDSVSVCLSVCLSVSLSLSLARSFSHFTNLKIQSIIPKNHKHTCSFHTFQKN